MPAMQLSGAAIGTNGGRVSSAGRDAAILDTRFAINHRCRPAPVHGYAPDSAMRTTTEHDTMARIAIGGFQHETNTFAPVQADLAAFENSAAFPRVPRAQAVIEEMADLNVPIGGFIHEARAQRHDLHPTSTLR